MVSLYAVDSKSMIWINRYETCSEAIEETRQLWMEDDQPMLVVMGDSGAVLATLVRSSLDPEVCHTSRYDLSQVPVHVSHRCRYVLDCNGDWESEVTPLGEGVTHA